MKRIILGLVLIGIAIISIGIPAYVSNKRFNINDKNFDIDRIEKYKLAKYIIPNDTIYLYKKIGNNNIIYHFNIYNEDTLILNRYIKYYFNSTNYNNILIKEINNKKDAYVEYYYYNWNPKNLFRYFFINKEFIGKIIFHVPSDKILIDYE